MAERVEVPTDWGCCGFAGDRGLLHPELAATATLDEAAQVSDFATAVHVSCNRTCELGMTLATGATYAHILERVADAVSQSVGDEGAG